jgi:hypothetical protein
MTVEEVRPMLKLSLVALIAATLTLTVGSQPGCCQGCGDLLVTPTRIVFEGNTRLADVTLINTGDKPATYRIALVQRRMTELGGIEPADVAEPGELFATGLVRFSPSQIVLKPQECQTVRLQLRLPADLPAGEYRSHLQFSGVPDAIGPAADGTEVKTGGIGVKLRPIYGVSIAVIIRRGDLNAQLKLSDLKYTPPAADQPALLSFSMNRTGTCSTYGDLVVSLKTADGKSQIVGRMDGVAVYYPNPLRRAIMRLTIPPGTVTAGASVLLGYFKQDDKNAALWDQQSLNLEQ